MSPSSPPATLTQPQQQVLTLLSAGSTVTAAAAAAGVHRNTIATWRRSPVFRDALYEAIYEKALFWHEQAEELAAQALDTIRTLMSNPSTPASVRLKAALVILEMVATPPPPVRQSSAPIPDLAPHPTDTETPMHNSAQAPAQPAAAEQRAAAPDEPSDATPQTPATPTPLPPTIPTWPDQPAGPMPQSPVTPAPVQPTIPTTSPDQPADTTPQPPATPPPLPTIPTPPNQPADATPQTPATPSPLPAPSVPRPTRPIGRNDPCPCGSTLKFKRCCLNLINWKASRDRSAAQAAKSQPARQNRPRTAIGE